MSQQKINTKLELSRMKRGTEISVNGYTIKKVGTTWNVKKGDFYNRSFTEDRLPKLIEKLEAPTEGKEARKIIRKAKKATRMAAKLVAKNQKAIRKAQKAAVKLVEKEKTTKAKEQNKTQKPFKRNKLIAETLNLFVQGAAYFSWFVYFFTDYADPYLGEYSIYVIVGVTILAVLTHVLYSRQLGIKHRVANIVVGLLELGAIVGASVLYYGPLTHNGIVIEDILPSVEEAASQLEVVSLVSFMFIKWVSLFIAKKK